MIELNEETLGLDVEVIYKGREYKTGNRHCTLVDLWKNNTFFRNVSMSNITIKNPDVILHSLIIKRNVLIDKIEKINSQIYELEKP